MAGLREPAGLATRQAAMALTALRATGPIAPNQSHGTRAAHVLRTLFVQFGPDDDQWCAGPGRGHRSRCLMYRRVLGSRGPARP